MGLVIPGSIFAVVSVLSIGVGAVLYSASHSREFGLIFLVPSVLGLILNTCIIIAGAVKISRGKAMIGRAEKLKKEAYSVTFRVFPLISPKTNRMVLCSLLIIEIG